MFSDIMLSIVSVKIASKCYQYACLQGAGEKSRQLVSGIQTECNASLSSHYQYHFSQRLIIGSPKVVTQVTSSHFEQEAVKFQNSWSAEL